LIVTDRAVSPSSLSSNLARFHNPRSQPAVTFGRASREFFTGGA
jgi:hypothetical protein